MSHDSASFHKSTPTRSGNQYNNFKFWNQSNRKPEMRSLFYSFVGGCTESLKHVLFTFHPTSFVVEPIWHVNDNGSNSFSKHKLYNKLSSNNNLQSCTLFIVYVLWLIVHDTSWLWSRKISKHCTAGCNCVEDFGVLVFSSRFLKGKRKNCNINSLILASINSCVFQRQEKN